MEGLTVSNEFNPAWPAPPTKDRVDDEFLSFQGVIPEGVKSVFPCPYRDLKMLARNSTLSHVPWVCIPSRTATSLCDGMMPTSCPW